MADADREVALIAVVAEQQWQWSTSAVVVAGGLAGGIGWFVSRRMLSPIDRITATANRISATTLDERIALDGPDDELRRLSRTIDALLDRLEAAFEAQRRFVSHAAHELRTPLAVQRATLQIGLPDDATPPDVVAARTEMLEQNRRTEHLVESLLVLAEAERGLEGSSVLVDLGSCVAAAVGGVRAAAAVTGVSLSVEGTAPDGVVGEPVLVQQLLGNLLDNAVEYNVPGGVVRVELHAGRSPRCRSPSVVAHRPARTGTAVSGCRSSPRSSPRTAGASSWRPASEAASGSRSVFRRWDPPGDAGATRYLLNSEHDTHDMAEDGPLHRGRSPHRRSAAVARCMHVLTGVVRLHVLRQRSRRSVGCVHAGRRTGRRGPGRRVGPHRYLPGTGRR
ncbi:HAMP domain-containing protein [Curtobacterium sp. Csp1]|nr:HAMP domain-containing protein [Curtobacterium sp. Csp1]